MWQRIQTVWLIFALIGFSAELMPSLPLANAHKAGDGVFSDQQLFVAEVPLAYFGGWISVFLVGVSIFLFRNRRVQIIAVALANLVQLFTVFACTMYHLNAANILGSFSPGMGMLAGLAGLIFSWLASRAIRKDEELIRSMDRLR